MRTEILIWSLFILCLVVHSACEGTSNPKTGGYTPLNKQHGHLKLKDVYDMMNKSSRKDHQIMHEVQHLRIPEKATPSYGGASDLRHMPHIHHHIEGAASPLLAKPLNFFLFAVLRHVAVGSIIFALY